MKIELDVKETFEIPEGKHTGKIVDVQQREEPYHYVDLIIAVNGLDKVTLKYGAPANLSVKSKLGKLVEKFSGKELTPKEKIDITGLFMHKKVEFVTVNEETERGTFARIADGSLKPIK